MPHSVLFRLTVDMFWSMPQSCLILQSSRHAAVHTCPIPFYIAFDTLLSTPVSCHHTVQLTCFCQYLSYSIFSVQLTRFDPSLSYSIFSVQFTCFDPYLSYCIFQSSGDASIYTCLIPSEVQLTHFYPCLSYFIFSVQLTRFDPYPSHSIFSVQLTRFDPCLTLSLTSVLTLVTNAVRYARSQNSRQCREEAMKCTS